MKPADLEAKPTARCAEPFAATKLYRNVMASDATEQFAEEADDLCTTGSSDSLTSSEKDDYRRLEGTY